MRWHLHPRPRPARRATFARERDALEHLIATTDNVAVAELARLRLRAARFADAHLTPTAAATPARDVTPAMIEGELRRSAATTARAATATAGPSPRAVAALDRIAAHAHAQTVEPPPTRVLAFRISLAVLVTVASIAWYSSRDWYVEVYREATTSMQRRAIASVVPWIAIGALPIALRIRHVSRRLRNRRY